MDVHKESIDITLAEQGGEVRSLGQLGGDQGSAAQDGEKTAVEGTGQGDHAAGPCGMSASGGVRFVN